MAVAASAEAYTREVWSAVQQLWPNLGKNPARVVQPYIPVLPAFLAEAYEQGRSPEWVALEVMRFFLRIYIENVLSADERKAQLVDLHELSKRDPEESQKVGVLPFTAALFGAQQTVSTWTGAGKVGKEAAQSLNREVLCALLERPSGELSRLGWLTLEAARKG